MSEVARLLRDKRGKGRWNGAEACWLGYEGCRLLLWWLTEASRLWLESRLLRLETRWLGLEAGLLCLKARRLGHHAELSRHVHHSGLELVRWCTKAGRLGLLEARRLWLSETCGLRLLVAHHTRRLLHHLLMLLHLLGILLLHAGLVDLGQALPRRSHLLTGLLVHGWVARHLWLQRRRGEGALLGRQRRRERASWRRWHQGALTLCVLRC